VTYPDPERKSLLSSVRFEAMREGIEDYELLEQLQSKNPQAAQSIASRMIHSFTEYVRDPAELRKFQLELFQDLAP
jgi:chemotaxis methyl-accepting protein methylase